VAKGIAETMVDLRKFYPKFDERFEIVGHNLAIKTMVKSASSTRPLIVVNDPSVHPRFFTVFSSKLSSVFSATQEVLCAMIRAHASTSPPTYVDAFLKVVASEWKADRQDQLYDNTALGGLGLEASSNAW